MDPSHSRIVRVATLLEEYLKISFRIGLFGMLFFASCFIIYIVVGMTAIFFRAFNPPYSFFSLADPFFVIGGAVTGLFIVQSAGSFLLYHFLVGTEDDRSQLAVLMGFISLGFGGALLRATLPTAIQLLTNVLG